MENNKPGQTNNQNPINNNQSNQSSMPTNKSMPSTPPVTQTPKPVEKPKEHAPNHKPLYNMNSGDGRNNWIIIAFVVLALAAFAIFSFKQNKPEDTANNTNTQTQVSTVAGCNPGDKFSETSGKPCQTEAQIACANGELFDINTGLPCVGSVNPKANPPRSALGYNLAIQTYFGKNMLFNADCTPNPKILKAPLNTKVLFANNSNKTLEIDIPGRQAFLLPYHYMTKLLDKAGDFPISCNGSATGTVSVDDAPHA